MGSPAHLEVRKNGLLYLWKCNTYAKIIVFLELLFIDTIFNSNANFPTLLLTISRVIRLSL